MGSGPGQAAPERSRHYAEALGTLQSSIEALEEVAAELEKRLEVALRSETHSTAKPDAEKPQVLVPLAENLRVEAGRVQHVARLLRSVVQRLEI